METSDVQKVVLLGEQTVGNVKQVLKDALSWLNTNAMYAHPNSKVRQFKSNLEIVYWQIKHDEQKFLGCKFSVKEVVEKIKVSVD